MTNEEALRCVKKGRYAEADELIIEALEKQIPMRPIERWDGNETIIKCCACKEYEFDMSQYEWARRFCGKCGQRILWEDEVSE